MHVLPGLSIVTSVYRAQGYLGQFYERISRAAEPLSDVLELVFVLDGPQEECRAQLMAIAAQDARVVIVELSRNYGQHAALWAGLREARGERVYVIDCDLEEAPEHLAVFWERMEASDAELVFGAQKERGGPLSARWPGALFYWLLARACEHDIVPNVLLMRLMTRRYVDALLRFPEADPRLTILAYQAGFRQEVVAVEKRYKGSSSYTMARKLKEACDYLVGLSDRPLRWVLYGGVGMALLGLLGFAGAVVAGSKLMLLMLWAIMLATGIVVTALGILGLYLGRVLREVRGAPLPIVTSVYRA